MRIKMYKLKFLIGLSILIGSPVFLFALPQDLEVFTDFEDISGEGEFFIGVEPNRVKMIGFKVETLEDLSLLHSGSKAIALGPGEEGKIFTERGIAEIEFYVAENTGAGKIEARGWIPRNVDNPLGSLHLFPIPPYNITGLPTSINPDINPPVQRFDTSEVFQDAFDVQWYFDGIAEIKFLNVTGKLVIDDLGFTLSGDPRNNTVYTTFEEFDPRGDDITIGESPFTATFTNGAVLPIGTRQAYRSDPPWKVLNGETGTITFETPAARVQFYAHARRERPEQEGARGENEGTIQVFDTEDNLLITIEDLPSDINATRLYPPLPPPPQVKLIASELGAVGGIAKITLSDNERVNPTGSNTTIDDFGFTPIGAPGFEDGPPTAQGPSITTQPASLEIESGAIANFSVAASGDDLSYQWYEGNSGDTTIPITGATSNTFNSGSLTESVSYWVQVSNPDGSSNSDTAVITVTAPPVPLVLEGTGDIAGENIQHPNGNIFDQVLLTGESIRLQARPNQITRVSFMDEDEDIVQVEFSGAGTFTVTLDPATFLTPAIPPRYNQVVEYVTGKPSVVIDGADSSTFFSIFTVGSINAVNQALFPEGQVYDAEADVTLVEVINSTGMGGMQLSNTVFSGSTGKVGIDARGVPIAVRLTVGDIDADGDAVPHLLFGGGSFTVAAGNPGLRITGGDLEQTNGASIVVAESGSTTTGFEDTFTSQNNFKSDNTPQPTQTVNATFVNEDGDVITVATEEVTIE